MSEHTITYEHIPTTDRPAEKLARKHGFENLTALAESLPNGAHVLDVGSGASPFGREVASLRPDITWVNFDYSYNDPAVLADVSDGAPNNVEYVAGDATKLTKIYQPESFDAVFSYWMMPHLSLEEPWPAVDVARGIFSVTKTGGLMSVGPKVSGKNRPKLRSGKAVQTVKTESVDADTYVYQTVEATRLQGLSSSVQKLNNEVATPLLGTSRHAKTTRFLPKIYHPKSEKYVSPFSLKGQAMAARLVVAAAAHVAKIPSKRSKNPHN